LKEQARELFEAASIKPFDGIVYAYNGGLEGLKNRS